MCSFHDAPTETSFIYDSHAAFISNAYIRHSSFLIADDIAKKRDEWVVSTIFAVQSITTRQISAS